VQASITAPRFLSCTAATLPLPSSARAATVRDFLDFFEQE